MEKKIPEDEFECRAPQCYGFLPVIDSNVLDDGADEFFDAVATPGKANSTPKAPSKIDINPPLTTGSEDVGCSKEEETTVTKGRMSFNGLPQGRVILKAKRRSLQLSKDASADAEAAGTGDSNRRKLAVLGRLFEGITLDKVEPEKEHSMMTRHDKKVKTPTLTLRNRPVERLQLKRIRAMTPESKGVVPVKFRAVVEQSLQLQNNTPPRFNINPANADRQLPELHVRPLAFPESFALFTNRQIPPERQEQQSTDHPAVPSKSDEAKAVVVPSIKEPASKKTESTASVAFKARPIPKACRRSLAFPKSDVPVRSAVRHGQMFVKNKGHTVSLKSVNNHVGLESTVDGISHSIQHTEPKPFSFEMRDRAARQKKERKIQEAIEEKTRVPKFTAQPLPAFMNACDESCSASTISTKSNKSHCCVDAPPKTNFKARPPAVLNMEPFKPRRADKPLTTFSEFQLNTERRAKERAVFDKALKEMHELTEGLAKERQAIAQEYEKENLKQLRKNLVHKAKPVPARVLTAKPKIDE